MKVYLAGPINGCTDDEAVNWRERAKEFFRQADLFDVECIDPMRRDYRGREDDCVAEIVNGDLDDIDAADFVLANCWQPSWGTAMEIHYAAESSKEVVAVLPPGASVSPWLRYHTFAVVHSLDDALVHVALLIDHAT